MPINSPHKNHAARLYVVFGLLILGTWALLFLWQRSPFAELLSHESLLDHHFPLTLHLPAFLLGWCLMTIGMMLPGNLPILIRFAQPGDHGIKNARLMGAIILGYLFPWILFGLLAFLGDSFLHHVTESGAPLAAFSDFIAPSIVLTAGLYQLTPVKRFFMERCRSKEAVTAQSYNVHVPRAGILQQGFRLGINCVGSCWALMLLMFALGHHRLEWMLALTGIFAAERLIRRGYQITWFLGLILIGWLAVMLRAIL